MCEKRFYQHFNRVVYTKKSILVDKWWVGYKEIYAVSGGWKPFEVSVEGLSIFFPSTGGAGKTRFNVATPTNATVTCTAYVLPYPFQTKSI